MVEVQIIPEGVSGIKKTKVATTKRLSRPTKRQWVEMTREERDKAKKLQREEANKRQNKGFISNANDWHGAASKRAKRMQKDNARENRRLGQKQIRKLVRDSLFRSKPHLTLAEVEKLVDENMPILMRAYETAPTRELSTEEQTVRDARIAERKQIVNANRHRRKMNQPMSPADQEWAARGR